MTWQHNARGYGLNRARTGRAPVWTEAEEARLREAARRGEDLRKVAEELGRGDHGTRARFYALGLRKRRPR